MHAIMAFSDVVESTNEDDDIESLLKPENKLQKLQSAIYNEQPNVNLSNIAAFSRPCQYYCTSIVVCIGFLFIPVIILVTALHIRD